MPAIPPNNEFQRLEKIREYRILDTEPEKRFDDLTYLASFICQTPVAMINLIDSDRQWTKSIVGASAPIVPRDISFCAYVISTDSMIIVEDATRDPRFSDNPLVTEEPKVRFYAGVPVHSVDGFALGTLCVLDRQPRKLSDQQLEALKSLARQVQDQMELRRNLFLLDIKLSEKERFFDVLRQNEELFEKILESSRDGFLVEENERVLYMNTAYARLFGREKASDMTGLHLSELAASEDLERLLDYGKRRARGEFAPTLYEFKIQHSTKGLIPVEGAVSDFRINDSHYIITSVRDITDRKKAEADRENLILELREALARVKTLSGLLPICASCKKIRDDSGFWNRIEEYIEAHSQAQMTHGICPDCARRLYPEAFKE